MNSFQLTRWRLFTSKGINSHNLVIDAVFFSGGKNTFTALSFLISGPPPVAPLPTPTVMNSQYYEGKRTSIDLTKEPAKQKLPTASEMEVWRQNCRASLVSTSIGANGWYGSDEFLGERYVLWRSSAKQNASDSAGNAAV
jgi:hypothetical protein